jgi:uncharacterized protein
MSGSHPTPEPSAHVPPAGGTADPSMEDILASIRRILSEDESESARAASHATPEPHGADEVLALDASMLVSEVPSMPAPPVAVKPEATPQPEPPPQAHAAEAVMPAPPQPAPTQLPGALVAPEAAAAAASSVGALLRHLIAERDQVVVHRGGPTIEDLVREEIRPLLKQWLDTNLPVLAERLVRAEIERVVGRAVS